MNVNITSPDNSSYLPSGQNVYLNFTTNMTVRANYTFDSILSANLSNGTSFSALLNGTLQYGTLKNGIHNISIYVENAFGNNATINYPFIVNDTAAPVISINITNNSKLSATYLQLPINITSDEYANISYKINNNSYSNFAGLGDDKTETINITAINGQNNLTINATDFHYNSKLYYFAFYNKNFINIII